MKVYFLIGIEEHYDSDPPELFGSMRFPAEAIPKLGDVITLRWLDGTSAHSVTVIGF
jgi:hypothetical protein